LKKFHRFLLVGLFATGWIGLSSAPRVTAAFSDTRTISFAHIHTKETLTVTYKKNGKLVPEAMDQIDWIMRDWRRNEKTKMDSHTIDILWEMHTELGSKEPIQIICGYRSRGTNEMLRKTVGGQASESQHITGKAIDVTFPDVPLKQIRYSALIREQGGVGYYPTSGIPFVHVDTGRVRHWPRLPRYELALLFPNGKSQHNPSDGGALTQGDVRYAQANHKDLATQIAGFFNLHDSASKPGVMVADAGSVAKPSPQVALAKLPPPVAKPPERQMASLMPSLSLPKLVAAPKLVERPSRLTPGPSESDRSQLMTLVSFVAETEKPSPRLISGPAPVSRRAASPRAEGPVTSTDQSQLIALAPLSTPRTRWTQVAALDPATFATANEGGSRVMTDANRAGWSNGWVTAPAFDDEHPEELSYRPFPLAPLLTASASINEPVISRMVAPDVAKILQQIDQPWTVPQMHFLPGEQTAEVIWAQQFQGQPVQMNDAGRSEGAMEVPTKLIPRSVKTLKEG
jgi:uncharacterized protein YcbK (DUF882 family)